MAFQSSSSSSSSSMVSKSLPTTWSDILNNDDPSHRFAANANHLFPPLVSTSHKGSNGRIAIIGGSDRYCGAPYYAAMAALRCGVDLVTVLCANEASTPIKCYSPELMVQAIYSIAEMDSLLGEEKDVLDKIEECKRREQEVIKMDSLNEQLEIIDDRKENMINTIVNTIITQYFPTIHAVCIGPGLGRHPIVFSIMSKVIQNAMESKLVLVLDADALYMLSLAEYKILLCELLLYDKCVMTPNSMEMKRLTDALSSSSTTLSSTLSSSSSTYSGVHKLQNNSNIIIQKGVIDTINNNICTMQCEEEGGLKRCGGIGDVLSGSVTAFMAWNSIFEQQKKNTSEATNSDDDDDDDDDNIVQQQQRQQQQRVFACWSASVLVKKATKLAYEKKHRSMSAMNVLDEIGIMIYDMEEGLKQKI